MEPAVKWTTSQTTINSLRENMNEKINKLTGRIDNYAVDVSGTELDYYDDSYSAASH